MNYLFLTMCVDGGYGWGKTGQIGYTIVSGNSLESAVLNLKLQTPGGWEYKFVCMTDKGACINPDMLLGDKWSKIK